LTFKIHLINDVCGPYESHMLLIEWTWKVNWIRDISWLNLSDDSRNCKWTIMESTFQYEIKNEYYGCCLLSSSLVFVGPHHQCNMSIAWHMPFVYFLFPFNNHVTLTLVAIINFGWCQIDNIKINKCNIL